MNFSAQIQLNVYTFTGLSSNEFSDFCKFRGLWWVFYSTRGNAVNPSQANFQVIWELLTWITPQSIVPLPLSTLNSSNLAVSCTQTTIFGQNRVLNTTIAWTKSQRKLLYLTSLRHVYRSPGLKEGSSTPDAPN